MNKLLKKQTMKKLRPMMIIAAVLALGFFAVSCQGIFMLLAGPTPLEDARLESGEYVSFDASEVIVAFATLSVTRDSDTQVMETYYLLPAGDGTYLALMDKKEANGNVLERAMEQSHEYYLGDLENLTRMGDLCGTIVSLDEDMNSYMIECITNYSLPGYDSDSVGSLIRPIQVDAGRVGFLYENVAKLLFVVGVVFLLGLLALWLPAQCGFYQKKAMEQVLGDLTQEEAEQDFLAAEEIERIRVGKYVWYSKGFATRVLKTESLIWGYSMPEPLVVSKYRWPVALYDREQKFTQISFLDKKNRDKFLAAVASQGHPFVQGYSTELSGKFKSDFEGFVQDAENM